MHKWQSNGPYLFLSFVWKISINHMFLKWTIIITITEVTLHLLRYTFYFSRNSIKGYIRGFGLQMTSMCPKKSNSLNILNVISAHHSTISVNINQNNIIYCFLSLLGPQITSHSWFTADMISWSVPMHHAVYTQVINYSKPN